MAGGQNQQTLARSFAGFYVSGGHNTATCTSHMGSTKPVSGPPDLLKRARNSCFEHRSAIWSIKRPVFENRLNVVAS